MSSTPVRVFLPAILSGILAYLCFFPCDLGFLAWFALAPLFSTFTATVSTKRLFVACFVGGLFFFLPATQWIRLASPPMYGAWIGLALYSSLIWSISILFIRWLKWCGLPLLFAAPIVFVSADYFRTHFPTGFPWLSLFGWYTPIGFGWYQMGQTQHDWLRLIQIADVTGVYGITFMVIMANVLVWQWLARWGPVTRWLGQDFPTSNRPWFGTILFAAMFVVLMGYGTAELEHEPFAIGPVVGVCQTNIAQEIKLNKEEEVENRRIMESDFIKQGNQVSQTVPGEKLDLMIWPETSYPFPYYENTPEISPLIVEYRQWFEKRLRTTSINWRTYLLIGTNGVNVEGNKEIKANSALLFDRHGDTPELKGRFDKIHLVPFGEYIPYVQTLPFLKIFSPYPEEYQCRAGSKWTRFLLHKVRGGPRSFGCLICYEDTDPAIARGYFNTREKPVDFLVNLTNDGWFRGSEEHEQHLAISRFRAIECRRALVRSVNLGISALIDGDGRVIALANQPPEVDPNTGRTRGIPVSQWSQAKSTDGTFRATVPLDERISLYTRLGDLFALVCWGVIIFFMLIRFSSRINNRFFARPMQQEIPVDSPKEIT
ncbi:MAG: apolipoprotein N-acyltransferase [Gemmataceae bacterium]|jgi:apolipoprotein N-acyltransferase|nr:apolipoprotein N-acyltransferase [Gemmataceae bacterium]